MHKGSTQLDGWSDCSPARWVVGLFTKVLEGAFCELRIDGVLRSSHQVCVSGIIHGKLPVGNADWGLGGAKHDDAREQGSE